MKEKLNDYELQEIKVGEAITLTSVLAVMAVAVTAVIVYRLFRSKSGNTTLPGGWKFEWK